MRVAVNTRFFLEGELEGYGYFIKEVFFRLAHLHPEHQFIFLFDRAYDASIEFPANVTAVVVTPKARHALSFKWWYDVKVPLALKKYKADVFISPDGFCSLTTSLPQVLVIHDLAFLHYPQFVSLPHRVYYKTYTSKFLKKARVIATVSEFSKKDIVDKYRINKERIINVSSAAKSIFREIDWEERESVKQKYTDGYEYFLFVGGIHPRKNLLNLLKAFSLFKKRQRTGMKLLVAGKLGWQYKDTLEKLKSYKFKSEVKLLGYVDENELSKLVASAYALVYPSFFEGFGVPIVEAMQSGTPVITSNVSSMPEVGGSAALYANPKEPEDIAEQLKLIFKDEQLRSRLAEEGKIQAENFSWLKTAELMWMAIQKAVSG